MLYLFLHSIYSLLYFLAKINKYYFSPPHHNNTMSSLSFHNRKKHKHLSFHNRKNHKHNNTTTIRPLSQQQHNSTISPSTGPPISFFTTNHKFIYRASHENFHFSFFTHYHHFHGHHTMAKLT